MAITNDVQMPSDEELTVPHEITLSTPYFKAVAPYMHVMCENEIKVAFLNCFFIKTYFLYYFYLLLLQIIELLICFIQWSSEFFL